MRIPLPKMMRHWREREFERHLHARGGRAPGSACGRSSPSARRSIASPTDLAMRALRLIGRARGPLSPGCRSPAAGRDTAISPRRRARPFRAAWRAKSGSGAMSARDEILRVDPPLAACVGRRGAAPRGGRGAARAGPGGDHPAPRPGRRGRRALATFKAEAERAQATRRRSRRPPPTSPRRSRATCARTICPRRCAWATTRASARCPGRRPRSRSRAGPPTGTISTPSAPPSRRSRRPARWRSSPARTIRRRSTSCPTTTSSSCSPTDLVGDYESVFRETARGLWRRRSAAHAQFHHRPVALGRHRADAAARRARAAAAAYRRRRRAREPRRRKVAFVAI